MKNFLTAFIVFMVWSLFGLWIYSLLLPENASAKVEIENSDVVPILTAKKSENKEQIKELDSLNRNQKEKNIEINNDSIKIEINGLKATNSNGDIIFLFDEGIKISKNISEIFIPKKSVDYKYKINTYLLEHPNQELHINSIYSPTENVFNPNIGIQRANEIEKELITIGVKKEKIVLKSIIKNIKFDEDGIFNSGIYFSFKSLDIKRLEAIKKRIPATKLVYPKFTESGISVNNDLKILLSELIVYFSKHPANKITIIGHTDNIGNGKDNYAVGLKYARQVRWYLISKGDLKRSSIIALSKGESEPIANNNTKQGRITNRRIEVIFN